MLHLPHHGVQNAALLIDPLQAFFGVRAVAEQASEDHPRIDLHRQRRGWRAPRNRVHIGATEAYVARSHQPAEILGRQFQRRQRRLLADLLRCDLIDGYAGVNVRAIGALGMNAVQENRGGSRMIAAVVSGAARRRHLMRQIGHHHQLVFERLKRRERPRHLEVRALGGRGPVGHHGAVRDETHPELDLRIGRGLRQGSLGGHHRIEQRKRDRCSQTSQQRPAGKMFLGDESHVGCSSVRCFDCRACCLDFHLERHAFNSSKNQR